MSKIIRDLVHGYIEIDDKIEMLINTRHFQRLRYIKQLTCQQLFPSANHTRFEHSLGVYFLSIHCMNRLESCVYKYLGDKCKFDQLKQNLAVAALFHDIGHAPLSHLGERYFNKKEILSNIKEIVKNWNFDFTIFSEHGAKHELMSCYILLKYYPIVLKNLYGSQYANFDFELMCRMIVGAPYTRTNDNKDYNWLNNIGITILNSDTLDMDRLDYLLRDTYMTGLPVSPVDTHRLFKNMYITEEDKIIGYKKQTISVIQNIIDARDTFYMYVVNHHIPVYTDFLYEFFIKHMILRYEKGLAGGLDPKKYFSCNAVGEALVTDNDLHSALKTYINADLSDDYANYKTTLVPQIYERKFLKPLWKNLYEYKLFVDKYMKDIEIRVKVENYMQDDDPIYRQDVATKILTKLGDRGKTGDVFIVPRKNKTYSQVKDKAPFKIDVNIGDETTVESKTIEDLLPQKDSSDYFGDTTYYVFAREDIKDDVKTIFLDIAENDLQDKCTIDKRTFEGDINWLKDDTNF